MDVYTGTMMKVFIAFAVYIWFALYYRANVTRWLNGIVTVFWLLVVGILGLAVILAVIGLGFWGLGSALSAFSTVHGCLVMVFVVLVMLLFKK